jgi:hypothetical protein
VATKGISKTNDENKKFSFFMLVSAVCKRDKIPIQEEVLSFILA